MPDDSLLAGRTVAPSKPDNGTSRNSSGLSTDLVKIYKVCEFSIPSTFYYRMSEILLFSIIDCPSLGER
jgi:hypothetical protein